MEYTVSKSGRKIYAQEFKNKILKELESGKTLLINTDNSPVTFRFVNQNLFEIVATLYAGRYTNFPQSLICRRN